MKSHKKTLLGGTILSAAIAGLLNGSVFADVPSPGLNSGPSLSLSTGTQAIGWSVANADKHGCKGQNDCKGQGGCQSGDNGCSGKNSCKGKGGCSTVESM